MVVEIDVVPGAAGGEVGGLVALRAVDFTGARPAGQRQRFVIQVVVGHRCLQYAPIELCVVGDEQSVLQPFPDYHLISCVYLQLLRPTIRDNLGHYASEQKKEKRELLCGAVICSFLVPVKKGSGFWVRHG